MRQLCLSELKETIQGKTEKSSVLGKVSFNYWIFRKVCWFAQMCSAGGSSPESMLGGPIKWARVAWTEGEIEGLVWLEASGLLISRAVSWGRLLGQSCEVTEESWLPGCWLEWCTPGGLPLAHLCPVLITEQVNIMFTVQKKYWQQFLVF